MQFSFSGFCLESVSIGAVIADGILFAFLYHLLYEWRFGVWPALSPRLALLLLIWSLSSYIIGRYASRTEKVLVVKIGIWLLSSLLVHPVFCF